MIIAAAATPSHELDLFQLGLSAGGVVLGVLFCLIAFFVVTTFVIGYKAFQINRASRESESFLDVFWQQKRLDAVYEQAKQYRRSPIAAMFKAGYVELMRLTRDKATGEQTE